jgi:hypothetical protein
MGVSFLSAHSSSGPNSCILYHMVSRDNFHNNLIIIIVAYRKIIYFDPTLLVFFKYIQVQNWPFIHPL